MGWQGLMQTSKEVAELLTDLSHTPTVGRSTCMEHTEAIPPPSPPSSLPGVRVRGHQLKRIHSHMNPLNTEISPEAKGTHLDSRGEL